MATTPTWAIYVPIAIAAVALIVSAVSLVISINTYRISGPLVRGNLSIERTRHSGEHPRKPICVIYIKAVNRGRMPVSIERINLAVGKFDRTDMHLERQVRPYARLQYLTGPWGELPLRLESSATARWDCAIYTDHRQIAARVCVAHALKKISRCYLYIELENEKRLRCRFRREIYMKTMTGWILFCSTASSIAIRVR